MRAADLLRFCSRALSGHRLRTILSLAGVAVGVMAVVLLTSLGEGARLYVTGEFANLGTNLLILLPGKTETSGLAPFVTGVAHDLTLQDSEAILRAVPSIRRAAPLTRGTATAHWEEKSRDILVVGTTADFRTVRNVQIQAGFFLPEHAGASEPAVCVIGSKVRSELFGSQNPLGAPLRLGDQRFRVIGVLAPRGMSLGLDMDELVFVPVRRALKMFNQTGLARLLLEVRSHDEIPAAEQRVLRLLLERHGEDDVTTLTQDSVLATFGRILGVLTATLAGIAAVSLTVAGVGIMNVMLVSVAERTREIGLLKAVGVRRGQVVTVFLVEAALLSTAGGAVGIAGALAGAGTLRAVFPSFPAQAPWWAIAAAAVVSVSVGLVFGVAPARRAARLDPVVALARR